MFQNLSIGMNLSWLNFHEEENFHVVECIGGKTHAHTQEVRGVPPFIKNDRLFN